MRRVDPVKHEKKRQEILWAASDCFERKGFSGSSVAEICAAAEISPGHLYHYFASKEDIVIALADARLATAANALERLLDCPDPFGVFLGTLSPSRSGSRKGDTEAGGPALLLEILAEATRNPAIAKMLRKQTRTIRGLLGDVLKKGQEAGKVDLTLDPDLAASVLVSVLVDAAKSLTIRAPDVRQKEAAGMIARLVMRFLAPP